MSLETDEPSNEIELPGQTIYTPDTKIIELPKLKIQIPLLPEYEHELRTLPYTLLPKPGPVFTATRMTFGVDAGVLVFTRESVEEITDGAVILSLAAAIETMKAQIKPRRGIVKLSPDEYAKEAEAIVKEWLKWRRRGRTQEDFANNRGWKSRTILTSALSWYRDEYGPNSV